MGLCPGILKWNPCIFMLLFLDTWMLLKINILISIYIGMTKTFIDHGSKVIRWPTQWSSSGSNTGWPDRPSNLSMNFSACKWDSQWSCCGLWPCSMFTTKSTAILRLRYLSLVGCCSTRSDCSWSSYSRITQRNRWNILNLFIFQNYNWNSLVSSVILLLYMDVWGVHIFFKSVIK